MSHSLQNNSLGIAYRLKGLLLIEMAAVHIEIICKKKS